MFAEDRGYYFKEYTRDIKAFAKFECPFAVQGSMKIADDVGQARAVFNMIDDDRSGNINVAKLAKLMTSFGMPPNEAKKTMALFGSATIGFDAFYSHFKPLWVHIYAEAVTEKEKKKDRDDQSFVAHRTRTALMEEHDRDLHRQQQLLPN